MSSQNPSIALGLTGIADWHSDVPFLDHMKFARAWVASGSASATGATTNSAGYALGSTVITLASAGVGSIPVGTVVYFATGLPGDALVRYLVTAGDADVSNGGTITIEAVSGGGGLQFALPTSAVPIVTNPFNSYSYEDLLEHGYMSGPGGYVTSLPPGMTNIGSIFAPDYPLTYLAGKQMVLTWEGTGTVDVAIDVSNKVTAAHRITFTRTAGTTLSVTITSIPNPADPPRNLRMVRADQEALLDIGEEWNPDYVDKQKDARLFRFMDIMLTNHSPISEWSDRPLVSDQMYTMRGVPLEVMVRLSNKCGVDPWFCMPHLATAEYVEEFATYVRDNLNPGLVAHDEESNETWNTAFAQTQWYAAQAVAVWGYGGGDGFRYYYAKMATLHAKIWKDVFVGQTHRIVCLFGLQTVQGVTLVNYYYNPTQWATSEPGAYIDPKTVIDGVAVTSYLGGDYCTNATKAQEILTQITNNGEAATMTWWANKLATTSDANIFVPNLVTYWTATKAALLVKDPTALLFLYEGWQHFHDTRFSGLSAQNITDLRTFFRNFLRSADAADLVGACWDAWEAIGDGPFMQFGVINPLNFSGWSILEKLDDSTPTHTYMFDRSDTDGAWFGSGGGVQYLPETVDVDGGTVEFNVRGGVALSSAGYDLAIIPGASDDYTISSDADGILIEGANGNVRLADGFNCFSFAA